MNILWMNGWMDECMNVLMNEWINGEMFGCIDGWMIGLIGRHTEISNRQNFYTNHL